jgi:hypothetical protein
MGAELLGLAIFSAFASTAVSFAMQGMQQQDARRAMRETQQRMKDSARGHLINQSEAQKEIPLLYGEMRVGLNKVFKYTSGTDNQYLHIVGNIGEGEIEGIKQEGGVDQIFIGDKLWTEWGADYVHYEIFKGTAAQNVCSTLQAAAPEWDDPKRHTAYLYIRLKYDQNKFQGEPEITLIARGIKCFDPRSSTTAWTENPALGVRDTLTRSPQRGGMGIEASRIDDSSFISAANYCDTKGWKIGALYGTNQPVVDNIAHAQQAGRLRVVFSDNKFKCKYLDMNYESAVMDVTQFIARDGGRSSLRIVEPNIIEVPNAIRTKWINPTKKWQVDDFIFPDAVAVTAEKGYREKVLDLTCVTAFDLVQKLTNYDLERARHCKQVSFVGHRECMKLEPYDLIRLSAAQFGWVNKYFRVTGVTLSFEGTVSIEAIEEYSFFYDDTYNAAPEAYYATSLPSYLTPVPSVRTVSAQEETYVVAQKTYSRLKIAFAPPLATSYSFYKHTEIWVKRGNSADYVFETISTGGTTLDPVQEGITYSVKLVNVSIFETKENFASAYSISQYITGKASAPGNLSSLVAIPSADLVQLIASDLNESDIEGYEVRYGDSWDAGYLLAFMKAAQCRLVGVRPGTHTFWMGARDNRGRYSATKRSAQCVVLNPPNYTDKNTWAWDFTTGTFTNTEHVLYNSQHCLKCSHTGGNLTGTWLSPEYDLGSVKKCRHWGDFVTEFISSALTWNGLAPVPRTWADLGVSGGKRWFEIFATDIAAQLSAKIKYGNSSGALTNEFTFFQMTAPEFEARYVQVEVTITDPVQDAVLHLRTLNMKAAYWQ